MSGLGKKPAMLASPHFAAMFEQLSKAALIDTLYYACQLGTDDDEGITISAAKNAATALRDRGDRLPKDIAACEVQG